MKYSHKKNEHQARKRFGQNFLVDRGVIELIVEAIKPEKNDNLIEIGAGQGAITGPLLTKCPRLSIIELDRDLIPVLKDKFQQYANLEIHQGDALKINFRKFCTDGRPLRIVGNLPYNITTPLLFHLLGFNECISDMYFMLQKEVVDRLGSLPGQKSYGRLSVMIQYYCKVHPLFLVPPSAFNPIPKVDSAMVLLQPYSSPPYKAIDLALLSELVRTCFQQRRKTIRNSLKLILPDRRLKQLDVDLTLRPENLSVEQFVQLSNQMSSLL